MVRLGERACGPLQHRYRPYPAAPRITFEYNRLDRREIGDLLYLQDELSEIFIDEWDRRLPGNLDARAQHLVAAVARQPQVA